MPDEYQIHDWRLSCIWVDTYADLLENDRPTGAPLAFLGRPAAYADVFAKLGDGTPVPGRLERPWRPGTRPLFWMRYLDRNPVDVVGGLDAWDALVPLRGALPFRAVAPFVDSGRVTLAGYYYPHGTALVFHLACQNPLPLSQVVELAQRVLAQGRLDITLDGQVAHWRLDYLAQQAMQTLRRQALGSQVGPPFLPATPFTVFTVVRAVSPPRVRSRADSVRRALEALTAWSPTWQTDTLPALTEPEPLLSTMRRKGPDCVLYGHARGRSVWFPPLFTAQRQRMTQLACYHRNLVSLSQQVESLAGLMTLVAPRLQQTDGLPPMLERCARRAAGILGRLYGPADRTYRSASPQAQIDQNGWHEDVDAVRAFFDGLAGRMPPLARRPRA